MISDELRAIIKRRKLTAYAVGKLCGIRPDPISRWLSGERSGLNLQTVDRIVEALGLHLVERDVQPSAKRRITNDNPGGRESQPSDMHLSANRRLVKVMVLDEIEAEPTPRNPKVPDEIQADPEPACTPVGDLKKPETDDRPKTDISDQADSPTLGQLTEPEPPPVVVEEAARPVASNPFLARLKASRRV